MLIVSCRLLSFEIDLNLVQLRNPDPQFELISFTTEHSSTALPQKQVHLKVNKSHMILCSASNSGQVSHISQAAQQPNPFEDFYQRCQNQHNLFAQPWNLNQFVLHWKET